jgi:RNA polymerase sigma factor (sigma-70 family)
MNTMQKLVVQYVPLANKLAYQRKKTLPKFVDIEDLKSAAYLGLVEAATRFDPAFGVAFSTFAYPRIFGAIHDYLREQGWFKRGDLTPVLSLDTAPNEDQECSLKDTIEAKSEPDTEESFDFLTFCLEPQAKKVLRHYFIEDYSMKEVGEKIGISESRVSQLIKIYKFQIKNRLSDPEAVEELAA